jgi:hypothetical protein
MWFHRGMVINCAHGGVTEKLQLLHSQIKTVLYKFALFSPPIHKCLLQSHCSYLGGVEGQEDA